MKASTHLILSLSHKEALRIIISAVFPTASIAFVNSSSSLLSLQGNDIFISEEDVVLDQLREKLRLNQTNSSNFTKSYIHNNNNNKTTKKEKCSDSSHAYSDNIESSLQNGWMKAKRGPFTECCTPNAIKAWEIIYKKWPPELINNRPLYWYDLHEKSSFSELILPCWTPQAIIYIGGYESPDLRRIVAPQVFDQIPSFEKDDKRKIKTQENEFVGGETFDYAKRKIPKFAAKILNSNILLEEKGCALHDPDLLEISLPVFNNPNTLYSSSSSLKCKKNNSKTTRVQTFISFANSQATPSALQLAVDPMQRATLRPAFGYSLAVLKYSLPPPIILATRLLRRWNFKYLPTLLSAPFWLSIVGHSVERLELDSLIKNKISLLDERETSSTHTAAVELAGVAASLLNKYPEVCTRNYFMPFENFEAERGVIEVLNCNGNLPLAQLNEIKIK